MVSLLTGLFLLSMVRGVVFVVVKGKVKQKPKYPLLG